MGMTIGEVIKELSRANGDMPVQYSFGGLVPSAVDSWRGIYAEAAIGWRESDVKDALTTVKALLDNLNESILPGISFVGYKGGTYRYSAKTPLHIDNHGDCTNTEIERIEIGKWRVLIHARYEE